jgi:hypothetical protein
MHLRKMEDEIKGAMGMALAKQAHKIERYKTLTQEQLEKYQRLKQRRVEEILLFDLEKDDESSAAERHQYDQKEIIEMMDIAKACNGFREEAIQARWWQLIVHRQAVVFIVGNQKLVFQKFPIEDALPETLLLMVLDDDGKHESPMAQLSEKKQVLCDQLDWWQRIGLWK